MELQAKFYKNIFIISYDINVLKLANSTLKNINYFLISDTIPHLNKKQHDFLKGYCIEIKNITRNFVDNIHKNKKLAIAFTCDTKKQVNKAVKTGVDGIISNNPGYVSEYLIGCRLMKS